MTQRAGSQGTGEQRTGGQVVADALESHGVRTVFGVPGESYLALLNALVDTDIAYLSTRHEGGAAFMAEAWGKLTGEPGVCMVTRGPGVANASIAVHTAKYASVPMLLLVGDVPTAEQGREAFQEVDFGRFFGPIAKRVYRVQSVDMLAETMRQGFREAVSGRPGPVVVALPEDVLTARTDQVDVAPLPVLQARPSDTEIDTVVAEIERAERPLLIAGGLFTLEARRQLAEFAVANRIGVAVAFRHHDLIDNHADAYCGEAGVAMPAAVSETITEADLIIGLGIRFGQMTTADWTLIDIEEPAQRIVHIHPDPSALARICPADLTVTADPSETVALLHERTVGGAGRRAEWLAQRRRAFLESATPPPQPGLDMAAVMRTLAERLPKDVIVCNGAGNFSVWPNKFFCYGSAARLLAPQNGAMGYGLPAAIAAKAAHPERTVVCFAGDGDLQMTIAELGTARQHGCEPLVLVVDNAMYGTIRMHQEHSYPGREYGTAIANPDFAAIARAYGMHGERVERTAEFAPALDRALASPSGALLHLVVDPTMLTPFESLAQARSRR